MRPRTRAVGRRFTYKLHHLESRVNLCTAVIIAPSRVSVNIPLRKFEVIVIGPFAVICLHKKQHIDEPIPRVPEAAPFAVKIRLAAY